MQRTYILDALEVTNQRKFFDQLAKDLGFTKLNDWTKLTKRELLKLGGRRVLKFYNFSLFNALQNIYPFHKWIATDFKHVPLNFWKSEKNQRNYFDMLAQEFKLSTLDDWRTVTKKQVIEKGGSGILKLHGNSLFSTLQKLYPEHNWDPMKQKQIPKHFWSDVDNHKRFFDSITSKYSLHKPSELSQFTAMHIMDEGASGMLEKYYRRSLRKALSMVYPDVQWNRVQVKSRFVSH